MKTDQIRMNTPGERRTRKAQDSIIPVLTITHFDCADENGMLHYVGTDGGSVHEIDVIVPEGAEIDIVQNNAGFLELLGAIVTIRGNESSAIDGTYITGKGIRIVYSHDYVNCTFVELESSVMLVNIPGDVTE